MCLSILQSGRLVQVAPLGHAICVRSYLLQRVDDGHRPILYAVSYS